MDLEELDPNPIVQLQRWLDDAIEAGLSHPTAMSLATADERRPPVGAPRAAEGPRRARPRVPHQLREPQGPRPRRQPARRRRVPVVRDVAPGDGVGPVEKVSSEDSDAYFDSRDRGSQISAWASPQSDLVPDRAWLEQRVAELERRFDGQPIPRPPHWGGYRLRPDTIDFWYSQPDRLHDRFRLRATPTTRGASLVWHRDRPRRRGGREPGDQRFGVLGLAHRRRAPHTRRQLELHASAPRQVHRVVAMHASQPRGMASRSSITSKPCGASSARSAAPTWVASARLRPPSSNVVQKPSAP